MRTTHVLLSWGLALAVALPALGAETAKPGEAHVERCLVSWIDNVEVPAQEAGILTDVEAREGMAVERGSLLAQIDDSQAQMKKRVAAAELTVATAKAASEIEIQVAEAAEQVARKEYEANKQANDAKQGAISITELQRLWFQHRRAFLSIDHAKLTHQTDALTAEVRQVEVEAADNDIQRRKITSPLDGEVVEVIARAGEWVNPGSPVVRVGKLEKLWVDGFLSLDEYSFNQVAGRPVRVVVNAGPKNPREEFEGKIVFDAREVQGRKYRVKAEVVNRRDPVHGDWLLRPGMQVDMFIAVEGGAAPTDAAAAR